MRPVSLSSMSTKLVLGRSQRTVSLCDHKDFRHRSCNGSRRRTPAEEVLENVGQHPMEAAHIIPFLLNKFSDKTISNPEIVCDVLSLSPLTHIFVDR